MELQLVLSHPHGGAQEWTWTCKKNDCWDTHGSSSNSRVGKARSMLYILGGKVEQELKWLNKIASSSLYSFQTGQCRLCWLWSEMELWEFAAITKSRSTELRKRTRILFHESKICLHRQDLQQIGPSAYIPTNCIFWQYVVSNTHKGFHVYNRLPFGVASAPSIFQPTMEGILCGISNLCVYIDILISGETETTHLKTLDEVLRKMCEAGLSLNREKCAFMLNFVEYLGHNIFADGLRPTEEKIGPLQRPQLCGMWHNCTPSLGWLTTMINFDHSFPVHKWILGIWPGEVLQKCQDTTDIIMPFDPDKELILSCDASPYGLWAVLSHRMEDGSDKPVAFALRSLASWKRRACNNLWGEKVPPGLVWTDIYHLLWSQAPTAPF